jgi:hypothetical protein
MGYERNRERLNFEDGGPQKNLVLAIARQLPLSLVPFAVPLEHPFSALEELKISPFLVRGRRRFLRVALFLMPALRLSPALDELPGPG